MPKSGFLSKIGSSMYGISEGLLDTVSFGLTDTMTDKLWTDVVNKKGAENLSQFRGAGNMAGALGGAILTGNVSGAIEEGLEGFGSIAANSQNEKFQKVEQFANMGAQLSSLASGANKFTNFGAKMGNIASMPQVSQPIGQINSLLTSQPKMPSTNVPKDVVYSSKQSTNYAAGGPIKPRPIFVSSLNDPRLKAYNDSNRNYKYNPYSRVKKLEELNYNYELEQKSGNWQYPLTRKPVQPVEFRPKPKPKPPVAKVEKPISLSPPVKESVVKTTPVATSTTTPTTTTPTKPKTTTPSLDAIRQAQQERIYVIPRGGAPIDPATGKLRLERVTPQQAGTRQRYDVNGNRIMALGGVVEEDPPTKKIVYNKNDEKLLDYTWLSKKYTEAPTLEERLANPEKLWVTDDRDSTHGYINNSYIKYAPTLNSDSHYKELKVCDECGWDDEMVNVWKNAFPGIKGFYTTPSGHRHYVLDAPTEIVEYQEPPKIKNVWGEQIYTPNTDVYNIAQKRKDGQLYDHRYVIEQEDGSLIELPNAEQYKRYKEKYGLGNDLPVKYGRMPYFNSTPVITTFENGGPIKPGLSATRIMPMNPQQVQQMIRQNQQPQLTAQQLMMQRLAADNARRFNTQSSTYVAPAAQLSESDRKILAKERAEREALEAYNAKIDALNAADAQREVQLEEAARQQRLADAVAANKESLLTSDNWQKLLARQTQAAGDKLDVPFLPNWIDPFYAIGSMASGLGAAPYNIQQGNYASAAWDIVAPIVTGGLASIGAKTTGQFLNNAFNPVAGVGTNAVSKNLDDLKYAQKFAKQYGYDIPKNLGRISKSDELTSRTIRGLMNRHNSFVRGVSTNWDEIKKKNPDILRHLEDLGIDYKNNPRAAAEYMATHIPGQTGYGRYGLKPNEDAIYLSNSYPTAEGYTYGQGFMVKVKRPTDFSSSNRKDWIDYNKFTASKGFRNSKLGEGIVKTDYIKRIPITMRDFIVSTGDPNKINTLLKNATEIENLYKDLRREARYRYDDKIENFRSKVDANFRVRDNRFLDDLPVVIRDSPNILDKTKLSYLKSAQYLTDAYYDFNVNAKPIASVLKGIYGDPDVWKAVGKNLIGNVDPFSHYVIKGEPGQKVLDAVNFKQITPEIWSNKSRGHINVSSKGLTRYKKGGMIKRADGSYSKRGLWDNIRANRGSGKKPTKEMLEQERKIKAKK